MTLASRFLAVLLAVCWAYPATAQGGADVPEVRVRLFDGQQPSGTVHVTALNVPLTVTVDGAVAGALPVGVEADLDRSGGRVHLRGGTVDVTGALVEISGGPFRVHGGSTDRSYRGTLRVTHVSNRLLFINHVRMPDYVASVTGAEYPFSEIEGVKAQAILVRTYALHRQQAGRAYDVDDHQGSQVYKGIESETPTTRRAAEETFGVALYYGSSLAEALYSSSSGGYTASNESVWGTTPKPYLRGVPDPYDADAPDHTWRTTADAGRVFAALSARYGRVTDAAVADRSRDGRVLTVRLTGDRTQTVSGADFRVLVNARVGSRTLRSTYFSIDRQGNRLVFDGRGFGHGVGMSQYGARGQARAGRSYDQILAYYFGGTQLRTLPYASTALPAGSPPMASLPPSGAAGVVPGTVSVALPREPAGPVPVVRGTWGPVRARPTPRASAHADAAQAARTAATTPDEPSGEVSRRKAW